MLEQSLYNATIDENHESFFYTDFLISYGPKKNAYASLKARNHGNRLFSGENYHDEQLHKKVLIKYSQSIALAPMNSIELVSAIANRSYLLRHLGKYNECIIDIDLALKYNVMDIVLKLKLFSRKVFCLCALNKKKEAKELFDQAIKLSENLKDSDLQIKFKILQDLNNSISKKPIEETKNLPKYELPKNLPFISNSVTVNFNEKYGRHMIATQDLKPGEIIVVEKAYCAHPDFKDLYILCSYCLKQTYNSRPCNYCPFAMYCSDDCKKRAWEKYHELECSVYPLMFSQRYNLRRLILSRLFLQAIKEIGIKGVIENHNIKKKPSDFGKSNEAVIKNSNTYEFCSRLASNKASAHKILHIKEHEKDFPIAYMKILKKSKYFIDDSDFKNNYNKLINVLVDLTYVCSTNNFSVSVPKNENFELDSDENYVHQIACALYPVGSYFNHSCHPNVHANYLEGPTAVLYTIRSVKKNEQLFETYGPGLTDSVEDRGRFLLKKYNFKCDCTPCKEKWPVMKDASIMDENVTDFPEENRLKLLLMEKTNNLTTEMIISTPFSSWSKKKNALKDFCKLLECYDLCLPPIASAVSVYHFKYILFALMQLQLGSVFQVPGDCQP